MSTATESSTSSTYNAHPAPSAYAHFTACDACRKRKKRCDGLISGCAHCAEKGLACIYTPKKPRAERAATQKTGNLDERLRRIEQAVCQNLSLSSQVRDGLGLGAGEGNTSPPPPPPPPQQRQREKTPPGSPQFEGVIDIKSKNRKKNTSQEGCLKLDFFIGASSPFSYISRAGVSWIDEQLGGDGEMFSDLLEEANEASSFLRDISPGNSLGALTNLTFGGPVSDDYRPDPAMTEFFVAVNPFMPLFESRASFDRMRTTQAAHPTTAAVAQVLTALGAQHTSRTSPHPSHRHATSYHFQTAIRHLPGILLGRSNAVASVQALLGMIQLLLETDAQQSTFTILGLAASLASALGLHRDPAKLGITHPPVVRERIQVWWALYCLEKDLALRTGRATAVPDFDVDVPRPDATLTPYLARRVELAEIQSAVVRLLYSASTPHVSAATVTSFVSALSTDLAAWLSKTPIVSQPLSQVLSTTTGWDHAAAILRIRWAYLATLMSVFRLPFDAAGIILQPPPHAVDVVQLARREVQEVVAFLRTFAPGAAPPRTALVVLVAHGFTVFMERLWRHRCGRLTSSPIGGLGARGSYEVHPREGTGAAPGEGPGEWRTSAADGRRRVWVPAPPPALPALTKESEGQRERDLEIMRAVVECLECVTWREGEGEGTREFMVVVVGGLVGFVESWGE
ncbi:hypothetical protein EDC01DRAFT_629778 [Geopyxis carbonaria]|nr:hypothetical protein EDC01DRAFT_629778 [Geopyxis carbonaria]